MVVEELVGRLSLQTKGIDKAKQATKAIQEFRKALQGLAAASRMKLDGPARMARGLKDAQKAAERAAAAQKKLASGAGLSQADAAARKHVSTVQRLSAAYKDAAKNQALLGRGPKASGRSWIQGELDALRRYRAEMRAVTKEAERLGVPRHRAERMARVPYGDRGGLGEAVAAGAIANNAGRATRYAVEQGAVTRQETNRQVNAGMEAKQIAELDRRATELSAQFPSVDATKIRVMGRDARNMFPTFEMAMKALPEMVRARVMLQAAKGVDAADNEMGDFLKGADILGKTEDLESFTRLLNSYTKAVQVEGRQLPLKEYKEFSKYSKAGGVNLSDEFMGAVAPTFMQSEGGGRFGTQIASGISSLISGKRTKRSTAALMELGLLDKKGNLKNAEKYQTNPYQYAIEDMMPALSRKKINVDNDKAVAAYMSKIFSNSMTENLFTKLITQRAQVERNIKTYRGAKGLDAAKDQTRSDPYISWEAIVSQFRNILGTTLDENVALAGKAGATLAENMGDLNKSLKERPATAQAVGAAGVATSGLIAGKAGLELWRWLGRTFGVGKQGAIGGGAGTGTGAATAAAEGAVAGTGSAAATSTGAAAVAGGLLRGLMRLVPAAAAPLTMGPDKADQTRMMLRLGKYAGEKEKEKERLRAEAAERDRENRRGVERTRRDQQAPYGERLKATTWKDPPKRPDLAERDRENRRGAEMMRRDRASPLGGTSRLAEAVQSHADSEKAKLAEIQTAAQKVIDTLNTQTTLKVDSSQIDAAQAKAEKLKATMAGIGSVSGGIGGAGLAKGSNSFTSPGATAP